MTALEIIKNRQVLYEKKEANTKTSLAHFENTNNCIVEYYNKEIKALDGATVENYQLDVRPCINVNYDYLIYNSKIRSNCIRITLCSIPEISDSGVVLFVHYSITFTLVNEVYSDLKPLTVNLTKKVCRSNDDLTFFFQDFSTKLADLVFKL